MSGTNWKSSKQPGRCQSTFITASFINIDGMDILGVS